MRDACVPLVRSRGTCLLMWCGVLETRLEGCLGGGGGGEQTPWTHSNKIYFSPPTSAVLGLCSYVFTTLLADAGPLYG